MIWICFCCELNLIKEMKRKKNIPIVSIDEADINVFRIWLSQIDQKKNKIIIPAIKFVFDFYF